MPKILEIKNAPDGMWVKVGMPGDFPSVVTLWTPEEKEDFRNSILMYAVQAAQETVFDRDIIDSIRSLMT